MTFWPLWLCWCRRDPPNIWERAAVVMAPATDDPRGRRGPRGWHPPTPAQRYSERWEPVWLSADELDVLVPHDPEIEAFLEACGGLKNAWRAVVGLGPKRGPKRRRRRR